MVAPNGDRGIFCNRAKLPLEVAALELEDKLAHTGGDSQRVGAHGVIDGEVSRCEARLATALREEAGSGQLQAQKHVVACCAPDVVTLAVNIALVGVDQRNG